MRPFIIFCLAVTLVSCRKSKNTMPEGIVKPDRMVEVLADIHLAEAWVFEQKMLPEKARKWLDFYYDVVFRIHHVTREEFTASLDFYRQHPETLDKIYEEVVTRLNVEMEKYSEKYYELKD